MKRETLDRLTHKEHRSHPSVDSLNVQRRAWLKSILGAGLSTVPTISFGDEFQDRIVSKAKYIAGAQVAQGEFAAIILDADGQPIYSHALPQRAHGAAVFSKRGLVTVFARRPGRYMCSINLSKPAEALHTNAVSGRHYYGHGTYTVDGGYLLATENDYERVRGVIGVYDVGNRYKRINEIFSSGVGPHEMIRIPASNYLVIANGGIQTHPEHGREKLNISTMKPSVSIIDVNNAELLAQTYLPDSLHKLSIRHLAVTDDGTIWFAGQYQDDQSTPETLAGSIKIDQAIRSFNRGTSHAGLKLITMPIDLIKRAQNYLSSVATNGNKIMFTSSKGGFAFDLNDRGEINTIIDFFDCSGIAAAPINRRNDCYAGDKNLTLESDSCTESKATDFILTSGTGQSLFYPDNDSNPVQSPLQWDNHATAIM